MRVCREREKEREREIHEHIHQTQIYLDRHITDNHSIHTCEHTCICGTATQILTVLVHACVHSPSRNTKTCVDTTHIKTVSLHAYVYTHSPKHTCIRHHSCSHLHAYKSPKHSKQIVKAPHLERLLDNQRLRIRRVQGSFIVCRLSSCVGSRHGLPTKEQSSQDDPTPVWQLAGDLR